MFKTAESNVNLRTETKVQFSFLWYESKFCFSCENFALNCPKVVTFLQSSLLDNVSEIFVSLRLTYKSYMETNSCQTKALNQPDCYKHLYVKLIFCLCIWSFFLLLPRLSLNYQILFGTWFKWLHSTDVQWCGINTFSPYFLFIVLKALLKCFKRQFVYSASFQKQSLGNLLPV